MKLQCGSLFRDRRPGTSIELARILGEFNDWQAETTGESICNSVILAYRGDRITIEERNEVQPVALGRGALTWDGRLDNRSEIAHLAALREFRSLCDAEIVAAALEQRGEAVIRDLIGEFALCVWSEATHTLLFARSVCGSRPLFYVETNNRVIWSSDLAHLVRVSGVDPDVNDTYMLQFLFAQPNPRYSPFRNIAVVPPGTVVSLDLAGKKTERAFWDWSQVKPVRYAKDEEYEQHCLDLIKEAVRVRLNTRHDVFSELSGGLDSSTVVTVGDEVLRLCGQNKNKLKTISCIYETSKECDEQEFIREVELHRNFPGLYVQESQQMGTMGFRDIKFTGVPNPFHSFPGRFARICQLMEQHDARVLLTGYGGDHLFWSYTDGASLVADELRELKMRAAHRQCILWSRLTGVPYVQVLFSKALPLVLDSVGLRKAHECEPRPPRWLSTKYRAQLRSAVLGCIPREVGAGSPSERSQRRAAEDLFAMSAMGYFNEFRSLYVSHPYVHRPLVEFCVSVPVEQFTRDGDTRSLMRRALRGILPEKVRTRHSKPMLDEAIARIVQEEWKEIGDVRKWRLCELGYATPDVLTESLSKIRLGLHLSHEPMLRLFNLERWLRSLQCIRRLHQPNDRFRVRSAEREAREAKSV